MQKKWVFRAFIGTVLVVLFGLLAGIIVVSGRVKDDMRELNGSLKEVQRSLENVPRDVDVQLRQRLGLPASTNAPDASPSP